ncbi:MAG: HEPN domain-containing protein [Planctomycetota bacterium]
MNADDFLSLAGKLAASTNAGEATYRSAVSRAYYGAFHLANSLLTELGHSAPRTANVHVFVQHHLNGSGEPSARLAASLLSDLHAARNRADYQLQNVSAGTQAVARLSVETAHEIRTALVTCIESPAREQVLTGLAAYAQRIAGTRRPR